MRVDLRLVNNFLDYEFLLAFILLEDNSRIYNTLFTRNLRMGPLS
jgi:hypothetical protein